MKRYQPYFNHGKLYEWTSRDNSEYILFEKYTNLFLQGRLDEFSIPKAIKDKFEFIKELSVETGFKIKDLFKLFLNKYVFKFFTLIGWSITKLFNIVKSGYKAYQDLQKVITEYVHSNKVIQWTKNELEKLDTFLSKHPKTRRIVGVAVAVAGLLIYIWLTMSFTGDALDDFDITMVFASLTGHATLSDVFGTPAGTKMLMLFVTGAITGLGFPWGGSSLFKFSIAVIVSLAKLFKQKISKGNDISQVNG
jgi:hypothetical protein